MEIETAVSFLLEKGEKSKDQIIEWVISYFDVPREEIEKIFGEVEKKFTNWQV